MAQGFIEHVESCKVAKVVSVLYNKNKRFGHPLMKTMKMQNHSQGRVIKSDEHKFRKMLFLAGLGVIIIVVISTGLPKGIKDFKSHRLASTVKKLQGHTYCSNGLEKLSSVQGKLNKPSYSNSAREEALNYLMGCNFIEGHKSKAYEY